MEYIKRGVSFVIILLFLMSVAFAAHSAYVTTDYVPIYETTSGNFSITVLNSLFSQNSINNVTAILNGFGLLSTFYLTGWQSASTNNTLSFFTSDHKISNWGSQTFGFSVKANKVDSNQTFDWVISSYDTAGDVDETTIHVLVINDDTAPIISNVIPQNGSFIKKGTKNQQFSFDAIDPETGVSVISGAYGICGNLSNTLSFTKINDSYLTTSDLSAYDDSTVLCYEYSAQNNGGETATINGQFTIDGIPPAVSLLFPENGVFMNNNSLFQFSARDNLAPTISCNLYADNMQQGSAVINNGESANVSIVDLPDGEHKWNVTCSDLAGNIGASETRNFILDRTPPLINVTSPAKGTVNKAGIPVNVSVTDNYGVSSIWYEFQNQTYSNITTPFSINTENATDGENHIIMHAIDLAGNEAVLDYIIIVDRQAPLISLVSPVNNGTFDVHVPVVLTATDNYDNLLDCSVIVDSLPVLNFTAENGNITSTIVIVEPGSRIISVQCKDDSDNLGNTSDISINVVDMSGPDIIIKDINDVTRGETALFSANITDISGVDSAAAILILPDGSTETIPLSKNMNLYNGSYPTTTNSQLGTYTLVIVANDTAGNDNNASQQFNVIHSYIITLDVTSPVYENDEVRISGTATRDDGEPFAGDVNVALPSGNKTLKLTNNSFSTSFSAPSSGTYNILAWITEGNRIFSASQNLEVKERKSKSSGGGGGGSRHSSVAMNYEGNAGVVEPECRTDSDCKNEQKCEDGKCISIPKEVVVKEKEKLEPAPAEPKVNPNAAVNVTEKWEEQNVGVGKATGFLNLENINWSSLLWVVIAIVAVALIIKILAGRGRNQGKIDYSELDRYISMIRRSSR